MGGVGTAAVKGFLKNIFVFESQLTTKKSFPFQFLGSYNLLDIFVKEN